MGKMGEIGKMGTHSRMGQMVKMVKMGKTRNGTCVLKPPLNSFIGHMEEMEHCDAWSAPEYFVICCPKVRITNAN